MLIFLENFSQTRFMPVNGKFAFVKPYYPNLITEPKYESVQPLNEYIFLVSRNGKLGIVDSTGNEIIKADTYSHYFEIKDDNTSEKFYELQNPGTITNCLVNSKGKCIAKNFYFIEKKIGDLLIVSVNKDDPSAKDLFFAADDKAYSKNGIVDLDGNWIAKPDNRTYFFMNNNVIIAYYENMENYHGEFMLLDKKGKAIIDEKLNDYSTSNNFLTADMKRSKIFYVETDEKRWFIDSLGKIVSAVQRTNPGIDSETDNKGKWGAKQNGKWIIDPAYDKLGVTNNYVLASNNIKHITDVYDRRGKRIATLPYHNVYYSGYGTTGDNKQYYVGQSAKGFVLLNDKFLPASQPQREIAPDPVLNEKDSVLFTFESFTKLRGVMNRYGKIIIAAQYKERIYGVGQIIRAEGTGKLLDLYDQTGKLIIKGVSNVEQSQIDPGFYMIKKNGKEGIYSLNPFKEVTIPLAYTGFLEIPASKLTIAFNGDKKYLLDKNFRLATTTAYRSILKDIQNDSTLVLVDFNGKKQFVDTRVNKINIEIDEFDTYSGSGINEKLLVLSNKKYGVFNAYGKTLLACEWDTIINVGGGAILRKDNKYFLADTNFNVNKNIAADSIISIEYGEAFAYRKNNKWHFFNDDNIEFDKIVYATRKDFIEVKSNGKTGIYNMVKKTWLLKPLFDSMPDARNTRTPNETLFSIKKGGQNYIIDPLKGTVKPEGYSYIESANYNIDARVPAGIDNFIVYNGSDKPNTGKFGIMNYKGEFLHPLDGDQMASIILERYDLGWASLIGLLWNKGGLLETTTTPGDTVIQESFDENGNPTLVKIASVPAPVERIKGGKFGIVNSQGKEIIPVIYDDIQFMYTYYAKDKNARRSFSNYAPDRKEDKIIIHPVFLCKDKKYGAADLSGKIIIPVVYDSIADLIQNEKEFIQVWKNKNFGIFDLYGKEILPVEITYQQEYKLNYYNPGFMLCQKGGTVITYTLIAQEREVTKYLPETGDEMLVTTKDTIELQQLSGGKFGLFDQDNFKWLLNAEYDDIRFPQYFNVDKTDKIIKMKVTEKFTLRPEFILRDSTALFEIKKADKWGVYQLKKGIILQPVYEDVDAPQAASSVKIKQNGKWGIVNLSGQTVLKPEFDEITLLEESIYKATQGTTINYYTLDGKLTQAK